MIRYITALLNLIGPMLNQVSSLNSLWGWNVDVADPVPAGEDHDEHDQAEVQADAEPAPSACWQAH